jgi:hypothetical protein
LAVVILSGTLIGAMACGSGGNKPSSSPGDATVAAGGTPIPGSTQVVVTGSVVPTQTPTPWGHAQETAVAQGKDVPLADYTDPDGHFTVGLPVGWTIQPGKNAVRATLAGDPVVGAYVGVSCTPDASVVGLVQADQTQARTLGLGDETLAGETPITVAGVTARRIPWQGSYAGVTHDNVYIYFSAKGCGWRMVLTTYPSEKPADMQALFQRVIDSLRLS